MTTPLTAVILAGGKGERLWPLTEAIPKPLVPLRGRPLLEHLVRSLAASGIGRFVLCTGYLADQIAAFAASVRAEFPDIRCVDSGAAASMTDRLRDAAPQVEGRALVCYGDTIGNVDVAALVRHHEATGATATVTVHPLRSPFGIVDVADDGRVSGFREKPELPFWINVGYIVCEPRVLRDAPPGTDLATVLGALAAQGQLQAFRHTGSHLTVNTERERRDAEQAIARVFTLSDQDYQ